MGVWGRAPAGSTVQGQSLWSGGSPEAKNFLAVGQPLNSVNVPCFLYIYNRKLQPPKTGKLNLQTESGHGAADNILYNTEVEFRAGQVERRLHKF